MSVKIKRRILVKYETFIIIWILSERIKNNDRFDDPFMRIYFCIIHNFVSFDSFDWRRNHFPRHFSILQNNSLIAVQSTNCINFEYQYFVSTVNKKPGCINYAWKKERNEIEGEKTGWIGLQISARNLKPAMIYNFRVFRVWKLAVKFPPRILRRKPLSNRVLRMERERAE